MKRMIEVAKQILDWVMQNNPSTFRRGKNFLMNVCEFRNSGEVSTRKGMDKNTRHCERSASSRVVKQSHETQSKIHVILNGMKWSEESLLKEKPKKKILRSATSVALLRMT